MSDFFKNIMIVLAVSSAILIFAGCSGKTGKSRLKDSCRDTLKISLAADMTDSLKITFLDPDRFSGKIAKEDIRKMSVIISHSAYDTAWNDHGIMVKMAAPDNILFVYSTSLLKNPEQIMVWQDGGKLKSRGKWFTLSAPYLSQLFDIINKYEPGNNLKNQIILK